MTRSIRAVTATALALAAATALAPAAEAHHAPGTTCTPGRALVYKNTSWLGRPYEYRVITSSFPGGLGDTAQARSRTLERIRDGIRTWNEGRNDCHFRRFKGFTTSMIGTSGASGANHEDGNSTIDFAAGLTCADTPGVVLGCASVRQLGGVPPVITKAGAKEVPREADVRFQGDSGTFTARRRTRGCSGRYDLWGTSSHEMGHVVGLGDLLGDGELYQTMYKRQGTCDFTWRQLGRSDYIGLTRLYTRQSP